MINITSCQNTSKIHVKRECKKCGIKLMDIFITKSKTTNKLFVIDDDEIYELRWEFQVRLNKKSLMSDDDDKKESWREWMKKFWIIHHVNDFCVEKKNEYEIHDEFLARGELSRQEMKNYCLMGFYDHF